MKIQTGIDSVIHGGSPSLAASERQVVQGATLIGRVSKRSDDGYQVCSGQQSFSARKAFSCLMEVEPGDTVQCLRSTDSSAWILAVLDRAAGSPSVLRCPADTSIVSTKGHLNLQAESIGMRCDDLQLDSKTSQLNVGETEVIGGGFRVVGRSFKLIGKALHSVMDQVTQFSRNYLRTTHGLDRVQSQHIEMNAKKLVRLSGEHTMFEGEKLVKTRGSQIHFG